MNRRAHHPVRRHARPTKGPTETRSTRPAAETVAEAADGPEARASAPRTARRVEVTLESSSLAEIAAETTADDVAVEELSGVGASDEADSVAREPSNQEHPKAELPSAAPVVREAPADARRPPPNGHAGPPPNGHVGPPPNGHVGPPPNDAHGNDALSASCTAPQLRRFIKSRAYVPMHELRRRFGIEGVDDDVTGVEVERDHRVYVGLPDREGRLLGELFRAGDVGYELSLDPITPIVVGVFPMRPIARS